MNEYKVSIDGSSTLAEINRQIKGEEAGASEFLNSVVGPDEGRVSNIAKFKELPAGTVPPELTIVKQGERAPAGKSEVWSGVMVIEGTSESVVGYRATAF